MLSGKGNSTIVFNTLEFFQPTSFVDCLRAGWQISFVAAIDYTKSNGDPRSQDSLHYLGTGRGQNQYEQALWNVGNIVEPYCHNKLFPVFGFGGVVKDSGKISHCFPINFSENPEIETVANIVATYKHSLKDIRFGSTT